MGILYARLIQEQRTPIRISHIHFVSSGLAPPYFNVLDSHLHPLNLLIIVRARRPDEEVDQQVPTHGLQGKLPTKSDVRSVLNADRRRGSTRGGGLASAKVAAG
jgi:hypothetical protein